MVYVFIFIIFVCGGLLVLTRRLLHMAWTVEKSKRGFEEALREAMQDEKNGLVKLYALYLNAEKNESVEVGKSLYAKNVNDYHALLSQQPWKLMAWVMKLPSEKPIS